LRASFDEAIKIDGLVCIILTLFLRRNSDYNILNFYVVLSICHCLLAAYGNLNLLGQRVGDVLTFEVFEQAARRAGSICPPLVPVNLTGVQVDVNRPGDSEQRKGDR